MLYNKNWDKPQVKANPLSLENLVEWLETMPPRQKYDFFCAGKCMVGQWVKSIDSDARTASGKLGLDTNFYYVNGGIADLSEFVRIANSGHNAFTFGAALTRAREALSRR